MATMLRELFRRDTGGATSGLPVAGTSPVVPAPPPVAPLPSMNQQDAVGQVSRSSVAQRIFRDHIKGLEARRSRDLLSEKLTLHIDGTGDFQWADIFDGVRIVIPRAISEYRRTENILRLVVDNAVAHHTTMPLRYFAEGMPDRRAREQALINTIWANYLAHAQDLNGLFADALYLAMPWGFCPVHRYWRDDVAKDWYEGLYRKIAAEEGVEFHPQGPGMIDTWVGNPADHVFDVAARRGSIRWQSYGRMLPGNLVRAWFDHIPGVAGIEGTTKLPSASEWQRIARDWNLDGLGIHGSGLIQPRRDTGTKEDLIAVICKETAPGVDSMWPEGRLQMIAIPGHVDTRKGQGNGSNAVLLVDQDLPGRDFSDTIFYSDHRGTDVHGKPWVEPLDQEQVELNIALSKRWEYLNKIIDSPIVAPGGAITDDMADLDGYAILEVEPSLAGWRPAVMEWPQSAIMGLEKEIEEKRRALYTGGGYQASSRGEAPGSRMAYRAIVALQQADNTVHGPVNMRFRRSACDFMAGCWRQMKTYGDVPWLVDVVGDEYAHLVEPYIDANRLSEREPHYKLVNAFGASPEIRAQELVELMQIRGADGQVFLRTEEARRQYPNQLLFDDEGNPATVARRRAKTVARAIETESEKMRELWGFDERDITHPWVQKAARHVFVRMESIYPRLRDDDLNAHIATLSELTQDETADPIARLAAMLRQDLYYQWQAMQAGMMIAAAGGMPGAGPDMADGSMNPRAIEAETHGAAGDDGGASIAATAR